MELSGGVLLKNIFCQSGHLKTESDVEQFFMIRLLHELGYEDSNIRTKETVSIKQIGKGKTKKEYRPDYIIYIKNYPIIVIDVKNPEVKASDGLQDALMYSREINGEYVGQNPIKYCIGSNGHLTQICKWDENSSFLDIKFDDFQIGNIKFGEMKKLISLEKIVKENEISTKEIFEFKKPSIQEINGIFKKCHQLIWKKEKTGPTKSFYEFCKIMFVKLNEDKKLKIKIKKGEKLDKQDFIFSSHWIKKEEKVIQNPINSILFKNLKDQLEDQIISGDKKRIFEKDDQIDLKPSTIKQVVKLIENYNLISIDEDLNGRLFETFLTATIRGKELGQFFTPRNVVKFMTKMACLNTDFKKNHMDYLLDGCCGTGGFLIEIMADLSYKINNNKSLSDEEKKSLLNRVKSEQIYGVEASSMISRIARINMYLHGDGGSKIFNLDFLDKKIIIEPDLDKELIRECSEYKKLITSKNLKFDVILTNPPFSMRYSQNDEDEKYILEDYDLAYKDEDTSNMFASLQSNIMFIERYHELLKPHGKLLTIMDESLLNTPSYNHIRDFIKRKFIIKAIISLPENTFVKADTGVKSSILYLVKKENEGESQSATFMALCDNVGHNDSGRLTPELNELFRIYKDSKQDYSKGILGDFIKFENGTFENKNFDTQSKEMPHENMWKTFVVESFDDRLDVKSNSPYLQHLRNVIKNNNWDYLENLITIEQKKSPIINDFYRLVDLRNVEEKTANVLKINEVEELNSDKILFIENQLLISMLAPEKGKIIFVDEELEGCVGSTELKPVTLKDERITIEYLWAILRSKIVLDQWKFQITGSTPSRYRIGETELNSTIIPIPDKKVQHFYSSNILSKIEENKKQNIIFKDDFGIIENDHIIKILKEC